MDTTISPQIKLVALVGLLGALALAGGMFFLSRAGGDAAAAAPLPPPAVIKPKPKPAVTAKPKRAVKSSAKAAVKAKPAAVKVAPKPKPAKPQLKPKARPAVAPNGLPTTVADQLVRHDVVVVALYAGGASVDRLARDEAEAGAEDVEAGFAAVDVLKRSAVAPLLKKADNSLSAPAILVFGRDGKLKARLNGFADRLMVAELAASARAAKA